MTRTASNSIDRATAGNQACGFLDVTSALARAAALDLLLQGQAEGREPRVALDGYLASVGRPWPAHIGYALRLVEGLTAQRARIEQILSASEFADALSDAPARAYLLTLLGLYELLYVDSGDDLARIGGILELGRVDLTSEHMRHIEQILRDVLRKIQH